MTNETQNALETVALVQGIIASPDMASDKQFDQMLKAIRSTGTKFRDMVHQAAMQALLRAQFQDNYDYANRLMLAVVESTSKRNQSQLQIWFETYGSFAWRKTEDKNFPDGRKFRKDTSDTAVAFNTEGAFSNPWYTIEGTTTEEDIATLRKIFGSDTALDKAKSIVKAITKNIEKQTLGNPEIDALILPVFAEKLQELILVTERDLNAMTTEKEKVAA
jgi:hypothetical protein